IVPAAGVQIVHVITSTPNNHLAAGPERGVRESRDRCVHSFGRGPTIRCGIVSSASVKDAVTTASYSAPDDHLTASPHSRVIISRDRHVDHAGSGPSVAGGIVPAAAVQIRVIVTPTPDNHLDARP